jgi:predicted nuclease with TOPRIM domain
MFGNRTTNENLIATLSELRTDVKYISSKMGEMSSEISSLRDEFKGDHDEFNTRLTKLEMEVVDCQESGEKKQAFNLQMQLVIITALVGVGLPQVLGLFQIPQIEKSASDTSAQKVLTTN